QQKIRITIVKQRGNEKGNFLSREMWIGRRYWGIKKSMRTIKMGVHPFLKKLPPIIRAVYYFS
ncbi:hypothetical protein, partial [Neobacillus cucumis]|uniref:hypothetical protein n=1 Tax=Neobacillus cucumis TaxID=1740721 RepID=UPI002E237704|nr:hypothetical protein [Neobacillus cucumis]